MFAAATLRDLPPFCAHPQKHRVGIGKNPSYSHYSYERGRVKEHPNRGKQGMSCGWVDQHSLSTLMNKIPRSSHSFCMQRDALRGMDWQFID